MNYITIVLLMALTQQITAAGYLLADITESNISKTKNKMTQSLVKDSWDEVDQWEISSDGKSTYEIESVPAGFGKGLEIKYNLKGHYGWVQLKKTITDMPSEDIPIAFLIKSDASGDLELKFVDSDGSVFGKKISLKNRYKDWTQTIIYRNNVDYWWGGKDDQFNGLSELHFAFSGKGSGRVWLDEIGFVSPGLKASFPPAGPQLDPFRELPGIGFRQRRDKKLIPEDPLVLGWLKQVQDVSSPDQQLLPSMQKSSEAHTFNNSLVAMAFILKGERERAERILDFFASATVRENRCPAIQNFFYKGEARGFFQYVILNAKDGIPAYHTPIGTTSWDGDMACFKPEGSDRWMGDMAWLLIAYKYYEKTYNSDRYSEITTLLKNLLISWYKDADDGPGGYVQHGWRKGGSKLHESFGHPEGNIDCYAAFKLCGEDEYARKVRQWLDRVFNGNALPLDLYTWRVLAYGPKYNYLLDIPEYDLRFRKTLTISGRKVVGLYHGPDINVNNIWLDGTGHIACAYITTGEKERGYFYSNQLDAFLIDREINGKKTRALSYTANKTGGYEWVEPEKGFISVAAWYIFAKNQFNPMQLTRKLLE